MNVRRAVGGLLAITAIYLAALVWIDSRNHVFAQVPALIALMPVVVCFAFVSYLVRYLRWHRLLARAGCSTAIGFGLLAYLAGFAFTATPGKVGELVRIRYLQWKGVPPATVLAAFVFERACDLVVVLVIAAAAIPRRDLFVAMTLFVLVAVVAIVWLGRQRRMLTLVAASLRQRGLRRTGRLVRVLRDGLVGCRVWFNAGDLTMSLVAGLAAWAITSVAFVWMIERLGISVPLALALTIYPLALLAGAASMLPGGIGTTEATIVVLLASAGVAPAEGALAAIGIRLSTLWFAVVCGFSSIGILELRRDHGSRGAGGSG